MLHPKQNNEIDEVEEERVRFMADIKYEIKETVGVIAESAKGWKKELNLISWNGKEAKYDLREWSPEHEKMGKGVTLSNAELKVLKELLNSIEYKK